MCTGLWWPTGLRSISFVGYKTQEIVYTGQPRIDVVLEEESKELSEIVVMGYSSVQKRDISGSVVSIKAEDFKEISLNGIDQALQEKRRVYR